MLPVGMTSISTIVASPSRMMAPSPLSLAICWSARSRFLLRAAVTLSSVDFSSVLVAIGRGLLSTCGRELRQVEKLRGSPENDDRPQTSRLAACAPNQTILAYATAILRGL